MAANNGRDFKSLTSGGVWDIEISTGLKMWCQSFQKKNKMWCQCRSVFGPLPKRTAFGCSFSHFKTRFLNSSSQQVLQKATPLY